MKDFYDTKPLIRSVAIYYSSSKVCAYHAEHPDEYYRVTVFVFDATCERVIGVTEPSWDVQWLRGEMIALEAPGMPPDENMDPDEYADYLWARLEDMVDLIVLNRKNA